MSFSRRISTLTLTSLSCLASLSLASCGGSGDVETGSIERYIRSDAATRLVLEVDAVEGFEPYEATEARLVDGLTDLLDKPDGIEAEMDGALDARGSDHVWTRETLFALATQTDDLQTPTGTAKMHVLFVDGRYEDENVLGLAWDHRQIAIFKQKLEEACQATVIPFRRQRLCENAEVSVLAHEVGHTIGLVDNGLPMASDHADPEHPHHDVDDACVMYWAYEGERLFDRLASRLMNGNDAALGFDEACRQDVAALRSDG